ncbi:peptidoglycan-binding protein [bacterium]|nr:peptidoglycan-binding protein [bacterium]
MPEVLNVLLLALLPAAGNFLGGVLSEWLKPSHNVVNRALHAASGIILAVVSVEVMPNALREAPVWLLAVAFMAGGGLYVFIDAAISRWQAQRSDGAGARAWMVYVAVSADLIGDGLLIGAGSAVSGALALVLALGQVLADIPEGFSVLANFRAREVPRGRRILLSASFAIPVVVSALLAYFLLDDLSEMAKYTAMVFVSGLYALAAVEDMLGEAHESAADTRWSAISFLGGYALFLLVSGMG